MERIGKYDYNTKNCHISSAFCGTLGSPRRTPGFLRNQLKKNAVLKETVGQLVYNDKEKICPRVNLLTPNVNYSGRTAPLISKVAFYIFIQQI